MKNIQPNGIDFNQDVPLEVLFIPSKDVLRVHLNQGTIGYLFSFTVFFLIGGGKGRFGVRKGVRVAFLPLRESIYIRSI